MLEPRTPGSLFFAPKVLTSSSSVGKQPGCGEEMHPWDGDSAPCLPHLSYIQHMSVMQGIKTSKAATGRRFVICFVPVPELKIAVLCQGSWPGAELSKDPVLSQNTTGISQERNPDPAPGTGHSLPHHTSPTLC